jgi:hypothetical protein
MGPLRLTLWENTGNPLCGSVVSESLPCDCGVFPLEFAEFPTYFRLMRPGLRGFES